MAEHILYHTVKFHTVKFEIPQGWETEYLDEMQGLLVLCPDFEGDWQANLFFELRKDEVFRDLPECVKELESNLKIQKTGFQLIAMDTHLHGTGFPYGMIEYNAASEGVRLHEQHLLVPLRVRDFLFVLFSSAESKWTQYRPVFEHVLGSLRITG